MPKRRATECRLSPSPMVTFLTPSGLVKLLFKINLFPRLDFAIALHAVVGHEFLLLYVKLLGDGGVCVAGCGHHIVQAARTPHGMVAHKSLPYEGGSLLGHATGLGVVTVKGIALYDRDKACGIVGVCGIAAFPELPGVIVGHVKVKQLQIARATQKKGVVVKTLFRRVVYAETFVGRVAVAKHLPPLSILCGI